MIERVKHGDTQTDTQIERMTQICTREAQWETKGGEKIKIDRYRETQRQSERATKTQSGKESKGHRKIDKQKHREIKRYRHKHGRKGKKDTNK